MDTTKSPRVALYSHDGMGLGHLRRNALIACGLARAPLRASALLIGGARELGRLTLPPSVESLTLPGFCKVDNGHYEPRYLDVTAARLVNLRRQVIHAAMEAYQPDVFIVDKVPEGMHGELLPTLELLQSRGTRLVLGLRDILDEPEQVRREWRHHGSEGTIEEFFDEVWVYGDPTVYDLVREYRLAPKVAQRTRFTGYLDPRLHPSDAPARGCLDRSPLYIVCQVGGGEDGGSLAEAFARAEFPTGTRGVLIQGPYLPDPVRRRVGELAGTRADLHVLGFVPGAMELVRGASRVVSMGGYNSVCEILATERTGLIVPRVKPRKEQRIRAQRMSDLGLLDWLHPADLSPDALSDWMAAPRPSPPVPARRIDFGGLDRLAHLTLELGSGKQNGELA